MYEHCEWFRLSFPLIKRYIAIVSKCSPYTLCAFLLPSFERDYPVLALNTHSRIIHNIIVTVELRLKIVYPRCNWECCLTVNRNASLPMSHSLIKLYRSQWNSSLQGIWSEKNTMNIIFHSHLAQDSRIWRFVLFFWRSWSNKLSL